MLIFMEYCAEGTIEEVAKQGLPESMVRKYTAEILIAINVLHDNGIVHRDIKGLQNNSICLILNIVIPAILALLLIYYGKNLKKVPLSLRFRDTP